MVLASVWVAATCLLVFFLTVTTLAPISFAIRSAPSPTVGLRHGGLEAPLRLDGDLAVPRQDTPHPAVVSVAQPKDKWLRSVHTALGFTFGLSATLLMFKLLGLVRRPSNPVAMCGMSAHMGNCGRHTKPPPGTHAWRFHMKYFNEGGAKVFNKTVFTCTRCGGAFSTKNRSEMYYVMAHGEPMTHMDAAKKYAGPCPGKRLALGQFAV